MQNVIALARSIAIPMQIVGADGEPLFTNELFNRALGLAPDHDWSGADSSGGSPSLHGADSYARALQQAIRTGEVHDCEVVLIDGGTGGSDAVSRQRIAVRISPIPTNDNKGEGHTCIVMLCPEVLPEHKDESELLRIQRGENLQRLASGVSHEFNNLFTGIKGLTELIKGEVDHSSEVFEFAEAIQETVDRGSRLIQQLSNFARDEPYSLVLTEISGYVKRSLPLLEIQLERGNVLKTEFRAEGHVMLDASRMDQALSNLLHNARDALDGSGKVLITVEKRKPDSLGAQEHDSDSEGWVMLEVADSGPGIPEQLHEQVIRPFFTTKEAGKSTGLGLSSTSKIVEMHDGVMTIGNSEELGGAAIRIFLPLTSV